MPSQVHEIAGAGLEGIVEGKCIRAGSHQLIFGSHKLDDWALRALRRASWRSALSVFISIDGRIAGALLLGDELRKETPRAVQSLRSAGIARIVMVTGDRADAAETIAAALDIDAVLSDRDPSDKVDAVAMENRRWVQRLDLELRLTVRKRGRKRAFDPALRCLFPIDSLIARLRAGPDD